MTVTYQPAHTRTALYYPYIEFRDRLWLMRSLCIWDRIARLVPAGYTPNDPADVRELVEIGAVQDIVVDRGEVEVASRQFADFLNSNECQPAALQGGSLDYARLHRGKVGERLAELFESISTPLDAGDEWYGVPASLGHGYVMYLAEAVARSRCIVKVTDSRDVFAVSPFYDADGRVSGYGFCPDDRYAHIALALMSVIPRDVDRLSVGQLTDFREKTSQGRRAFFDAVDSCARSLVDIENKDELAERVQAFRKDIRASRYMIREQSRMSPRHLAACAITTGCSALTSTMGLLAGGRSILDARVLGPSIAVAAIATAGDAVLTAPRASVGPVRSYYVDLRSSLLDVFKTSRHMRENELWGIMEEFVND